MDDSTPRPVPTSPTSPELRDHPGVILFPPLLYGLALALGLLGHWVTPRQVVPPAIGYSIGGLLLALGLVLTVWGKSTMERAGTNVNPALPTTALVVAGPFRFSRNPLYLGTTLIYLGLTLMVNSLWLLGMLVPLLVVLYVGVIKREERYLEAKFGDEYRRYRALVRCWL